MALIVDTQSGTILNAEHCVFIKDDALSADEWEEFNELSSDDDVSAVAKEVGTPVLADIQALDAAANLFATECWSSELVEEVTKTIAATGRITLAD